MAAAMLCSEAPPPEALAGAAIRPAKRTTGTGIAKKTYELQKLDVMRGVIWQKPGACADFVKNRIEIRLSVL
jgi:hypothetical protein